LIADHVRDQTRDQRPVRDALPEPRVCGEGSIQVQWVVIARDFGERHNVRLGNGFADTGSVANFKIVHDAV
jgi:hypothetical protein